MIGGLLRDVRRAAGYRSVETRGRDERLPRVATDDLRLRARRASRPSLQQFLELIEFYALKAPVPTRRAPRRRRTSARTAWPPSRGRSRSPRTTSRTRRTDRAAPARVHGGRQGVIAMLTDDRPRRDRRRGPRRGRRALPAGCSASSRRTASASRIRASKKCCSPSASRSSSCSGRSAPRRRSGGSWPGAGPGCTTSRTGSTDIDAALDALRAEGARLIDETPRPGSRGTLDRVRPPGRWAACWSSWCRTRL